MLAGQPAIGSCGARIHSGNRVQVRKWELDDRATAIGATDQTLIGVPQAVHLSPPVADVGRGKNGVLKDLVFGTKACLLHVARPLVGILSSQLQLGQIKRGPGDGAQWESILKLEDWSRTPRTLVELYVLQERRIEFQQAF